MALAGAFDGQEKESVLWRFIDLTSVGVERCPLCRWGEHCHCSSQVSRPVKRKQILFGIFYCVFQILEKVAIVNWFLFQFKNKDCSLFWSKALSPTSVSLINFCKPLFPLFLVMYIYCRLGAHKRKGEKPGAIVQDFKVIQIIAHEKYNKRTQSNDVALLKLDREARLNR